MAIPQFVLGAVLLSTPALGQSFSYEKYQLQNGLTVILHEDHSFPQACVNVWFRVGSKDEVSGRSGFAHLFEHLMFMGTERVPGAEFDLLMEAGGGWNNASTSEDRTNYYSSGPSELLPTLLWLEADRLEDLGRMMTQEKLDAQRAIVRNERRQTSENQPYGKAELATVELLYPEAHPYHHPVIGSHEDLEAATVEDVQGFFATYYVPNNASLVVAGDFEPDAIKPLIDSMFGTLPRGNDAIHRTAGPVRLDEEIVHTMVDDVQFARTSLLWHSPPVFQPGDAELDLVAAILSDGVSSRLVKKLVVEQELASEVSAYQSSSLLGSVFAIVATARPGVPLKSLEIAIDEVLSDLRREGPTDEELARAKAAAESSMRAAMETIQDRADALNRYEFHYGEPNSFERDLARYLDATPGDARQWVERVLGWRGRLVLRVLPRDDATEHDPRDARPEIGAAAGFRPPIPDEFDLENGIRVLFWRRPGAPFVELVALTPCGSGCDPLGRSGRSQLSGDMLDEGAGGRNAQAFTEALQALGAELSVLVDPEGSRVHLAALRRTFHEALLLQADAIQRPTFEEREWERVHELHRLELEADLDSPAVVASRVAAQVFFGAEHPYGRPVQGKLADVGAITLADARGFHRAAWQPAGVVLLAGGDISTEELKSELEDAYGRWTGSGEPFPIPLPVTRPAAGDLRVVLVDRPDAVQTVVTFLMPAPLWSESQRPGWELLSTILGGTFTSRLNQNLREKNGYSYGARARYSPGKEIAYLSASSAVRTDVTGAAIGEFLAEFRALRGGNVSSSETQKARATWRRKKVEEVASVGTLLDVAVELLRRDLPMQALEDEQARFGALFESDLNQLAQGYVPYESGVLVLVGDEGKVMPQLAELGLPEPVRLTAEGQPLAED